MDKLKASALENFIPIVRDRTANYLIEECKKVEPKRILEIGTAIGYSGLLMLQATQADLVTIEKNEERYKQAQENFKQYGLLSRVTLLLGDALEKLEQLKKNGEKFDFIFLDGPKGQYIKYLPYLKEMLNKNGVMFTDNIDLQGLLDSPEKVTHKNRTMVNNMKKFLFEIQNDEELRTEIFHIDDGFSITKKM